MSSNPCNKGFCCIISDDLPGYIELMKKPDTKNCCWQKDFNRYYTLRRTDEYLKKKFKKYNEKSNWSFCDLLDKLGGLSPAFCSKLIAVFNPESPIIDSHVVEFFNGIGRFNTNKQYKEFFEKLCTWYENYGASELCKKYIEWFDVQFPQAKCIYKNKKIDFMLWALAETDDSERKQIIDKFLKGFETL